jgi:hypothetical protein
VVPLLDERGAGVGGPFAGRLSKARELYWAHRWPGWAPAVVAAATVNAVISAKVSAGLETLPKILAVCFGILPRRLIILSIRQAQGVCSRFEETLTEKVSTGENSVSEALHPAAPHNLPWFISGPHEGDALYVMTTVSVLAAVIGLGVLFFTLHSLPERLGHKKLQFEIVAVLGLLSLFTHIHAFWVAGLLLALIDLPDFVTPLKRIAGASEKIAGIEAPPEPPLRADLDDPPLPPATVAAPPAQGG